MTLIKHIGRHRSMGVLFTACGLAVSACSTSVANSSSASSSHTLTTVHVAQAVNSLIYLPLYVAQYDGLFKKQGLAVNITTASNGANAVSEVAAGSAQFSLQDPMIGVLANLKGASVSSIAAVVNGVPAWVVAKTNSGIDKVSQLSGKTISTALLPNTGTYLLQDEIKKDNLKNVTLDFVQIGAVTAPLLTGQTPVAVVSEPDLSRLQAMGNKYKIIHSFTSKGGKGYSYSTIVASNSYLATHASVARRFVLALSQAENQITKNPSTAMSAAMHEFPGLPSSVVSHAVTTLIHDGIEASSTTITKNQYNIALTLQVGLGNVKPGQAPFSKEVHNFP